MASAAKREYPRKIIRWVHSGRPSSSGEDWEIGQPDAYIYLGPLRGTVDRDGREIPVFNLKQSGYWGVHVRGRKPSEPELNSNFGDAIDDAYRKGRALLKRLGPPTTPRSGGSVWEPKRRWKAADEYWEERRRLARMSAPPLSAAYKPDPKLKTGFSRSDFEPKG